MPNLAHMTQTVVFLS